MRAKEYESISLNKQGELEIHKIERVSIREVTDIEALKKALKQRLVEIYQAVKGLKAEANEIMIILAKLEGKVGPISPTFPEFQLSPADQLRSKSLLRPAAQQSTEQEALSGRS